MGGSAGGLLVAAVANMSAQDYRAIVAQVPFVDVVTTMLDEGIPLTTNEYDEWGNPADAQYYEYILAYSPYDNVRAQPYPAMLVTTGLWDSQVQYYEPAKWVAKLRALKTDRNPLLLHVEMEAGHGGKSGRFQRYRETALEYAFLLWQLGITDDLTPHAEKKRRRERGKLNRGAKSRPKGRNTNDQNINFKHRHQTSTLKPYRSTHQNHVDPRREHPCDSAARPSGRLRRLRASILAKANWPSARRMSKVAPGLPSGISIAMISDCIRRWNASNPRAR